MFKTPKDDFGMDGMDEVGEYIAHHRAWSYIEDCKIDEDGGPYEIDLSKLDRNNK